jgi:hypothetical protein
MKEVAVLLLVALMLNGCGSSTHTAQSASGGVWQAQLSGGDGTASGLSFVAQFTVGGNGALSFQNFQFLTQIDGGCFPVTGASPSGTLDLTANSAGTVTGTLSFVVVSGGNTLTLTSTSVTGTLNTTTNVISGGSIIGTWAVTGGTGCNAGGTFTMSQSS